MVHRLPALRKGSLTEPVQEWTPPDPAEPEVTEGDEGPVEEPDPDEEDVERYPLFRGVLVTIAIITVAVAGLSFLQPGHNLLYVLAALVAGGTLYGVAELLIPLERVRDVPQEREDAEEPDERHHEERDHR